MALNAKDNSNKPFVIIGLIVFIALVLAIIVILMTRSDSSSGTTSSVTKQMKAGARSHEHKPTP